MSAVMTEVHAHFFYALAWLSFALGHSILAAQSVKAKCAKVLGPTTRLAYNGFAVLHILAVLGLGLFVFRETSPFHLPQIWFWLGPAFQILGLLIALWALRDYDLGLFVGTEQIRRAQKGQAWDDHEAKLHIAGSHQYMRHPLYSGCFLILWGGISDPLSAATALWGSLYFIIGSRYEERRLIDQFGEAYLTYKKRVPAFLPYKGRVSHPAPD